jgi:hypothetical protein
MCSYDCPDAVVTLRAGDGDALAPAVGGFINGAIHHINAAGPYGIGLLGGHNGESPYEKDEKREEQDQGFQSSHCGHRFSPP